MSADGLAGLSFLFDLRTPADRLPAFGTYCSPTSTIPFDTPAQRVESRDEAAAKVLAVLRDLPTARTPPALAGKPCPLCAFRPWARPELPRFPLPPFEPYEEPSGDKRPYRLEFYGAGQPLRMRLSGVI